MAVVVTFEELPMDIFPGNDGNKEILVFNKEANTVYKIPLNQEMSDILVDRLKMTNEDLQSLIDKLTAQKGE